VPGAAAFGTCGHGSGGSGGSGAQRPVAAAATAAVVRVAAGVEVGMEAVVHLQ
jgi:hypothetical protein